MKRLIYAMTCLPMAGCLANSTPVGDINTGAGTQDSGTETADADNGTSQGSPGGGSTGGTTVDEGGTTSVDEGGSSGVGPEALDPVECLEAANAGNGAMGLNVGDWPLEGRTALLEGTCTVLEVDAADGTLTTTLECATEDTGPHTVVIRVGEPSVGSPDWAVDDNVELTASLNSGKGGYVASRQPGGVLAGGAPIAGGQFYPYYSVGIRRAEDGEFLLAATTLEFTSTILAPLEALDVEACEEDYGCGSDNTDVRLQYLIEEPGGESVVLTGGRHVELPLQDGSIVVFDAPRAHATDDCHYYDFSAAARRVTL